MPERIPASTSKLVVFRAIASSDHYTPATSKTIAITISKNGAVSFSNPNAGATNATEMASGFYKFTLDTTDTNTNGPLAWRGAGTGIDDVGDVFEVVNATNAGFTALPAVASGSSGGVPVIGTGTNNFKSDASANVTFANTSIATVTTVTNQLTAAQIATGVWQDATAGDFTVASSIGKALYIANIAPGASGGHMISGTNAGTTTLGALTVTGATTLTGAVSATNGSNDVRVNGVAAGGSGGLLISGSNTGTTTLGALTVTGATTFTGAITGSNASNNLQTNAVKFGGAAVTATTSVTFPSACTVATTTGAVGSVTGAVGSVTGLTASNLDATISSRMASYTQPTGFLAATFPTTVASPTNITSASGVSLAADQAVNATKLGGAAVTATTSVTFPAACTVATTTGAVGSVTGAVGSVTGLTAANLDVAVSSRMATYTQPTGFLAATFPGAVASTTNITSASGVSLAASQHVIVDSGTVTDLTNLPSIPANWLTAAGIAASALNGKGDWNVGKTGYSLTATTGLGNQTADITGNLSGSVGSVTGAVGSVTGLTASDVGAIKTQTDKLTFTVANVVDANVQRINDVTITGDGGTGTEFGV